MRVGILGGVFNPPHIGHLVCAQEAVVQLRLEKVVLVPVGEAPHRPVEQDPGAATRAEMCELAAAGDERLEVSRLEVERPGPSFPVDTLRELRGAWPEAELLLVLGADQAAALPGWREPQEVVRLATVAAVERVGAAREHVLERLRPLEAAERVVFFDMPRVDVSSTLVRRRVERGLPIRYLVPEAVERLIVERGLYGAPAPVAAE